MLPRPERLTTREFATAFSNSRAVRHPLLQVRVYLRNADANKKVNDESIVEEVQAAAPKRATPKISGTRAAFVVAKKIGKATVRNRLRRRVREIYRLHPSRARLQERSFDLIFLVSPPALQASEDDLRKAVDDVLRRVLRL